MIPARRAVLIVVWCFGFSILIFIALIANIYRHGTSSDIRKADTLIVLGAAQWNGEPSPIFQARLDRARELYVQGYATAIIVTGGKTPGTANSDSSIGKEYLVKKGVAPHHIFTEDYSRTTLQNLIFAQEIMGAQKLQSALLISHDFHMMRAKEMADDLGMLVFPAPVETENQLIKLRYAIREANMYIAYKLFQI